ncbi:bifunctional DNA-formamidopyrimidine glycosylase/DNA-(apurinic or apyrimidinic site) lyase [Candidatus Woesebacteria bacterium]|nr:bifunctional DNA-formamidopyrimidine glycosylase/DNA-(apurinic or apyrimidinic site) lyase [Candidatus Woesebacteria bacterium]
MPELPEVETIARRLKKVLLKKTIASIAVLRSKSFIGDAKSVSGVQVDSVQRRAKIIIISLSDGRSLLVHLKMTGQLMYIHEGQRIGGGHPTADFVATLPSKHTRIIIAFTDESTLFFNDMRVFGWIKVLDTEGLVREFADLGPDIISKDVTVEYLVAKLQSRSQSIKQVIMDNQVLAGVGNIYASDALHLAKINPSREGKSLSHEEVLDLVASLKRVINLGIEMGGASIQNYRNVDGLVGHYQDVRRVYAREGEPCGECGSIIVRMKQGGRSTFYCSVCQL